MNDWRKWIAFLGMALAGSGCAGAIGLGRTTAPVVAVDGALAPFGDWLAGCSNAGECTALLVLRRGDDPAGPAHIAIRFSRQQDEPTGIAIVREGRETEVLAPALARQLWGQLQGGGGDGSVPLAITGDRFAIARAGIAPLRAELARWRQMPPPHAQELVTIASLPLAPLDQMAMPGLPPDMAERCYPGPLDDQQRAWAGFANTKLYAVTCGDEGLNIASFWFVGGQQGEPPREILFTDYNAPVQPYNAWLEAETGALRMTHYFGGQYEFLDGDCGVHRIYYWTMLGMQLGERREMPLCGAGVEQAQWIVTYRAVVLH